MRDSPENPDTLVKVEGLQPGMMVDLQGDKHADPDEDHAEYEFEYAVVDEVTREYGGVLVEFRNGAVCFPLGHQLRVSSERYPGYEKEMD